MIYAETPAESEQLFQTYVLGEPENLKSSFDRRDFNTWILRLLAQVPVIARDEVATLLANTYGGYVENRRDPSWRAMMSGEVETLLSRMIDLGLLEVEGNFVRLTLLGRACGRLALSFVSALRLVDLLRSMRVPFVTAENMVAIVQVLEEADVYTPLSRGTQDGTRIGQATQRFGTSVVQILQRFAPDVRDYWARCKRAAVLFDWMRGVRVEIIESNFSTTPYFGRIEMGDIRRFADTTRFLLRSATEILGLVAPEANVSEHIDSVLNQLEVGIPVEALGLLALPPILTRGQLLDLYTAGISTPSAFWNSSSEALTNILSPRVVAECERRRPIEYPKPATSVVGGTGL